MQRSRRKPSTPQPLIASGKSAKTSLALNFCPPSVRPHSQRHRTSYNRSENREATMNAAVVQSFDAPPHYTTFADPVAGDGEHLVSVTAAALHPIVRALAKGTHYGSTGELPFIP